MSSVDLKSYIKQTLTEIVEGIAEAHEAVEQSGAVVSPKLRWGATFSEKQALPKSILGPSDWKRVVHIVSFDVAVTAMEQSGKSVGIGVAAVFKGNAGGSQSESTQAVSRLKFDVPIIYPAFAEKPLE